MDNFMDKIAQKLSAQEAIRANAAADAAQIDKLEAQIAEYDVCMKEMRKLNLKNAENEQKLNELLENSSMQIQKLTEESILKIQGAKSEEEKAAEIEKMLEELRASSADERVKLEEFFRNSEDFVHKENVKVYRNVQAAMVEELEKQTQALLEHEKVLESGNKRNFVISIITLITAAANLAVLIAHLAGLF